MNSTQTGVSIHRVDREIEGKIANDGKKVAAGLAENPIEGRLMNSRAPVIVVN